MLVMRSKGSELTSSSGIVASIWCSKRQLRTKVSLIWNIRLKYFVIKKFPARIELLLAGCPRSRVWDLGANTRKPPARLSIPASANPLISLRKKTFPPCSLFPTSGAQLKWRRITVKLTRPPTPESQSRLSSISPRSLHPPPPPTHTPLGYRSSPPDVPSFTRGPRAENALLFQAK
jgi:hypothetical protein